MAHYTGLLNVGELTCDLISQEALQQHALTMCQFCSREHCLGEPDDAKDEKITSVLLPTI